jgi:hypothetical protein
MKNSTIKKSITITRKLKPAEITLISTSDEIIETDQENSGNSPHVIRSSFTNYLKTEFSYGLDWEHPVTLIIYKHMLIKNTLVSYKYISPGNYKALYALITSSTNRETLANLFCYSPSTIRRKWDESISRILLMLIWPELTVEDFKIFPDC